MIDAANFEPQGKPTPAQVKAVWEQLHANGEPPSIRKLRAELVKRGFDISLATVGRYTKNDFRDLVLPGSSLPVDEKIDRAQHMISRAVERAPEQVGLAAAVAPPVNMPVENKRLTRMGVLMAMSEAEIAVVESKVRRVYNIILMEESIEIADKLATIPKDNAMMVTAQAEASAETTLFVGDGKLPPSGQRRFDPNDPSVIEGTTNPPNEASAAIRTFLKKEGLAA